MMDVTQLDVLADLLRFRERELYGVLMTRMAALAKQGKDQF
jgi:hypothetical protein